MDDGELITITNIAASIGKEKGLDKNFGMGAKVASLPSNRLGIRYRSCKDGTVHEIILCEREGVYGRLKRRNADGIDLGDVIDVTDEIKLCGGRSLEFDWTEVVLLGNRPDQNTVLDPYDGDPAQPKFWLATTLYHRFYRIPEGVQVRLLEGTHARNEGSRKFETIPMREKVFERHETVTLPNGIKIHYYYDAAFNDTSHNKSISGAIASAISLCGIVHNNELYSLLSGKSWTIEAPTFGIPFGAKHISVHIELPANFPVLPDGYRQFLWYRDGEQKHVKASDFALEILENRPEWLIEIIRKLAPNTGDNHDEIRKKLQDLLNKLRVRTKSPRLMPEGDISVERGPGAGAQSTRSGVSSDSYKPRIEATDLAITQAGAQMARIAQNLERAPQLIPLDSEEEIEQKNIKGRAGRYYPKSGELFINMLYPSVTQMREVLEKEYAHAPDIEIMKTMALEHSRNSMIQRVGLAVVFALAKRLNKEWDEEAMAKALEPESLSLAADNYFESLQDARRSVGTKLRMKRVDQNQQEEILV
jgi:hypothetical protein